jgi:hypothetical protein
MADLGELHTFTQKFTTSAGVDADPVVVDFWLREEVDGTELQWSVTGATGAVLLTPAGFSAMVKDSVGDFHVDYTTRKPERVTGQWIGAGTVLVNPPETLLVRHSLISGIEPQVT